MPEKNYTDTPAEAFKRIADALVNWKDATVEIVDIIIEAKDREIWKMKYDTWKDFCNIECGITPSWATRLVQASKAMAQITAAESSKPLKNKGADDSDRTVLPTGTVLALKDIDPTKAAEVLVDLREKNSGKNPTSAAVQAAVAAIRAADPEPAEPAQVYDDTGYPVPEDLREFWERRGEVRQLLASITNIETKLKTAQQEQDKLFEPINFSSAVSRVQFAHMEVKAAQLYAVCTTCQGKVRKACAHCKGRGFLTQQMYLLVPQEIRALREKLSKGKA